MQGKTPAPEEKALNLSLERQILLDWNSDCQKEGSFPMQILEQTAPSHGHLNHL